VLPHSFVSVIHGFLLVWFDGHFGGLVDGLVLGRPG